MSTTSRRIGSAVIATVGAVALLAACGQAPVEELPAASAQSPDVDTSLVPCIVSDAGGFDDRSFNQASYEGLTSAVATLGLEMFETESNSEDQYVPNINSLIDQGCNLIGTIGYLLAPATLEIATANPETNFFIMDDITIELDNVKSVIYDTVGAAFLAGYVAADYSETGFVGTYGGMQIPTVTIFMDGFAEGVAYYNSQKGTDVSVVGWDVESQTGSFTGEFIANDRAKQEAATLISLDADVLMPVGGPIYESAISAIEDSGREVAMIGVDKDLYLAADASNELFLTSVMKEMSQSVNEIVTETAAGSFSNTPYVGTLENGGVGIAPFHEFEDRVSDTLQSELDEVTAGLIDGSIVAESVSSPDVE